MRAVTTERDSLICRATSAKLCDSATRTKVSIAEKRSIGRLFARRRASCGFAREAEGLNQRLLRAVLAGMRAAWRERVVQIMSATARPPNRAKVGFVAYPSDLPSSTIYIGRPLHPTHWYSREGRGHASSRCNCFALATRWLSAQLSDACTSEDGGSESDHAAPLWLRAGDWQAAADAVGRIESWRRMPAPRSHGVGVGQRVALPLASEIPGGTAAAPAWPAARLDVAQRLAKRQLSEGHRVELVQTREALDLVFAVVARNAAPKCRQRKMRHDLRENELALMHRHPTRGNPARG